MAIKREYRCFAHGDFEGTEAKCPHGCTTAIEREFRSAPGTRSKKTKTTDKALERLAASFGMTDISNRNGSVATSKRAQPQNPMMDFNPRWGDVPQGGVFHQGGRIEHREGSTGGGAETAAAQYHTARIKDEIVATQSVPLPLGVMPPPPRPRVHGQDTVTAADFSKALASAK